LAGILGILTACGFYKYYEIQLYYLGVPPEVEKPQTRWKFFTSGVGLSPLALFCKRQAKKELKQWLNPSREETGKIE
jgi:hypothetical protein